MPQHRLQLDATPTKISRHGSHDSLLDAPKPPPNPNWSNYARHQGFDGGPRPSTNSSRRMYKPSTTWTWAFTIIALSQAVIALTLESYVFALFQLDLNSHTEKKTVARSIPTYLSLLIFGFLYQILLVYDALNMKNTIQIIGLCLYNLGILVYTAIEMDQVHDAVLELLDTNDIRPNFWTHVRPFLAAVPAVVGLATVSLSFVAWKLYDEFAWTIYKQISADLRMKRRFLIYQIYIAMLKFDFFFFVGFTVQFLVIVSNTTNLEFSLTIAALPITIVVLLVAAWAVKREKLWASVLVVTWYVAALGYFMFKLVRMYFASPKRITDYMPARKTLTSFAAITIMLMVITILIACWCITNYGKGLEYYIHGKGSRRNEGDNKIPLDYQGGRLDSSASAGPGPSRMVID